MDSALPTGLTRRRFLTAVGVSGGAAATFAALKALGAGDEALASGERPAYRQPSRSDFALQGRPNDQAVAILGGGIAGLTCAYELQKAGYDVTVIEAADRLGGRSWTIRGGTEHTDASSVAQTCSFADGRWLNAGPARIAQHHTTLDYCRELGVAVEVFVNANIDAYFEHDGLVRRRRSAMADLDGYIAELVAKAVDPDLLDAEITPAELADIREHLRSIGALGRADRGYESAPGIEAGTIGEPDDLALLLSLGVGPRLAFERDFHQAMPMFHPIGGMDRLVDALVAEIGPSNIVTRSRVTEVESTATGIRVMTEGNGLPIDADWGICCLQPAIAASLTASWPDDIRRALQEPRGVATGKIGLEYGARFWEREDRILGGASTTHPDVRAIWYPSTDYLTNGGVVVGAYPFGSFGDAFGHMTHDEREQLAVGRGQTIHGDAYRDELVSSFSVHWSNVRDIQAAWTTWTSYGASYRRLLEPAGRWLFAGDWLSYTPGWQHGALESARHAVTTLHKLALAN